MIIVWTDLVLKIIYEDILKRNLIKDCWYEQ